MLLLTWKTEKHEKQRQCHLHNQQMVLRCQKSKMWNKVWNINVNFRGLEDLYHHPGIHNESINASDILDKLTGWLLGRQLQKFANKCWELLCKLTRWPGSSRFRRGFRVSRVNFCAHSPIQMWKKIIRFRILLDFFYDFFILFFAAWQGKFWSTWQRKTWATVVWWKSWWKEEMPMRPTKTPRRTLCMCCTSKPWGPWNCTTQPNFWWKMAVRQVAHSLWVVWSMEVQGL